MAFQRKLLIPSFSWRGSLVACLGFCSVGCAKSEAVTTRAVAPDSTRQWSLAAGGTGADSVDAMGIDGAGNVLIGGTFDEEITFGTTNHVSLGGRDLYLTKLTSSGFYLWSRAFGSDKSERLTSLVVDPSGNIYLGGIFLGPVDFGGGALQSAGGSDIFVVKLDPNGTLQWAKSFGGPGLDDDAHLALDAEGNIVLTGVFSESLTIGSLNLTSAGLTDVFVTRLGSADGMPLAVQRLGGADGEAVGALAITGSGLTIIGGSFAGTLPVGSTALSSLGDSDAFLLKLSDSDR